MNEKKKRIHRTPLARVLEEQGITQQALIKALRGRTDAPQMSRYVNGKAIPGRRTAERIAACLPGLINELELLYPKRFAPRTPRVKAKA